MFIHLRIENSSSFSQSRSYLSLQETLAFDYGACHGGISFVQIPRYEPEPAIWTKITTICFCDIKFDTIIVIF